MRGMWVCMELTKETQFLIFVCFCSMFVIILFFFTELIDQQAHTNNIIKACNVSRNQIANDYDFNLIEYDQNHNLMQDFNLMDVFQND